MRPIAHPNHDLAEHLRPVAALARRFAKPFGGGDWAGPAGLWHHLGKYRPAIQASIRAPGDHAACLMILAANVSTRLTSGSSGEPANV